MKSKLNLFIDKETKTAAEKLAKLRGISVSNLFEDLIRSEREINIKLKALEKVNGSIHINLSTIYTFLYREHIIKKHRWSNA